MSFKLFPHQSDAFKKVREIHKSHNVAGGVMPTGSGKSFLAMVSILACKDNPNFRGVLDDGTVDFIIPENGVINDANIYYVSPTTDISYQVQKDIAQFILGKSETEISDMEPKDVSNLVQKAFPNLHFVCYQGLDGKDLEQNGKNVTLDTATPDLVITDEAHRSGADTFIVNLEKLFGFKREGLDENGKPIVVPDPNTRELKKNIKVLNISATPERDVDSVDMTRYWAELLGGFTKEELDNGDYLGINLALKEAAEKGIIVPPDVVHFAANLVDTEQYQYLLAKSQDYKISPSLRAEFTEELKKINREIFGEGYENFHLLPKEEQDRLKFEANSQVMAEAIESGKFKLDGKYIQFAPDMRSAKKGEQEEVQAEQEQEEDVEGAINTPQGKATRKHLRDEFSVINNMINRALKILGRDEVEIDSQYLSSNGFGQKTNTKTLKKFDDLNFDSEKATVKKPLATGLHFLTATQKLDEGVHVAQLAGAFMTKLIAQAGETITQRGQSIRFLQEGGRTMSADSKNPRVLFDVCCNVFRQCIGKVVDEKHMVPQFEMTSTEKVLAESYEKMYSKQSKLTSLESKNENILKILTVLSKYHTPLNADIIKASLDDTLANLPEFRDHSQEILAELDALGIPAKERKGLSTKLKNLRKLLYSGGKTLETFNIKELEELGILDRTSKEGIKEFEKSNFEIDDKGFVCSAPLEHLIEQNIKTGTIYGEDGKDINGFVEGQFNEEGYDKDGFNRKGFNAQGIHRSGLIHDEHGFMANGINILTGTDRDLLGFNSSGYRPIDKHLAAYTDYDDEVVVDRKGMFHTVYRDQDGKLHLDKISKKAEKYHRFEDIDIAGKVYSVDSKGFVAVKNINILTPTGFNNKFYYGKQIQDQENRTKYSAYDYRGYAYEGYWADSLSPVLDENSNPSKYSETSKVDMYGYARNGFDLDGINRDTGTRVDADGFTREDYKSPIVQRAKNVFNLLRGNSPDGTFTLPADRNKANVFDEHGRVYSTGSYIDMYGFTIVDYEKGFSREKLPNRFGFTIDEIPGPAKRFDTRGNDKYYKDATLPDGRFTKVNIFGCDRFGINVLTGQRDESLDVFSNYIDECVAGNTDPKEYVRKYAIDHRILETEAQKIVYGSLGRAIGIYGISPTLAKDDRYVDKMTLIGKQDPDKIKRTFFDIDPYLEERLTQDYGSLIGEIIDCDRAIDKSRSDKSKLQSNRDKKDALKKERDALKSVLRKKDDGR